MRFIFFLFFSVLFSISSTAQDKKMSTQEKLKELARVKKELEEQKKKEWDAYLVRVEADKLVKKQKKVADSIEKSKLTDNVKKDIDGYTNCAHQELPIYKKTNIATGIEEEIAFTDYIKKHIIAKFNYPEFAEEYDLQGRVIVYFLIDKQGNPQIREVVGPEYGLILEEEAIRIIKSLPTAIPANCDGMPVAVSFAIPILFQMEE
jgi:TonB family protein